MRTTYDKIYDGIYVLLWMLLAFGVGLSIGHGLGEKEEKPDGPEKKPDGVIVLLRKQDMEEKNG